MMRFQTPEESYEDYWYYFERVRPRKHLTKETTA